MQKSIDDSWLLSVVKMNGHQFASLSFLFMETSEEGRMFIIIHNSCQKVVMKHTCEPSQKQLPTFPANAGSIVSVICNALV